jgi:hypothetical protein
VVIATPADGTDHDGADRSNSADHTSTSGGCRVAIVEHISTSANRL